MEDCRYVFVPILGIGITIVIVYRYNPLKWWFLVISNNVWLEILHIGAMLFNRILLLLLRFLPPVHPSRYTIERASQSICLVIYIFLQSIISGNHKWEVVLTSSLIQWAELRENIFYVVKLLRLYLRIIHVVICEQLGPQILSIGRAHAKIHAYHIRGVDPGAFIL